MRKRLFPLLLGFILLLSLLPTHAAPAAPSRIEELIARLPLERKLAQLFMVSIPSWTEGEKSVSFTRMNDEVARAVSDYGFGGIIYFSDNIRGTAQIQELTGDLQRAAMKGGGIPLMIATDQEGGVVYRLPTGTALPGNMALGATYSAHGTQYARDTGRIIALELAPLGINTALSPVVDVNTDPANPVIGTRAYSDDPLWVSRLGAAAIEGMSEGSVVSCAKHFPGHGATAQDSHSSLPTVDRSPQALRTTELAPYRAAIAAGVDMIMTAHILYPQLEKGTLLSTRTGRQEPLPASLSHTVMTELLKEEMGFEGIVITDSMVMEAITDSWTPLQAAVTALAAGADMLCIPCTLRSPEDLSRVDSLLSGLEAAVEEGTLPLARVDDALRRILTVKERRGILDFDPDALCPETAQLAVGSPWKRQREREMAAAAVTVVRNEGGVLPLQLTERSRVLLMAPYSNELTPMVMGWNRAVEAGLIPRGAQVRTLHFTEDSTLGSMEHHLAWADTLIIHSEISSTAGGRMEHDHWFSRIPNALCDYAAEQGKTAIISSVDKPYDVQLYPRASAVTATYGCKGSTQDPTEVLNGGVTGSEGAQGPNITAAMEIILGVYGAQGSLPVDIPRYDGDKGGYTDEILYPRGFGLTQPVTLEGSAGPEGVTLTLRQLTGAATLLVGQYREGELIAAQALPAPTSGVYRTRLPAQPGCTYRAFLVGARWSRPLCTAPPFALP